jgi:hypothetical protein
VTEPMDVTGATVSRRESVTVGIADPAVRLRVPLVAQVDVRITPEVVEHPLERVPIAVRNTPRTLAVEVEPEAITVVVRGLPAAIDGLSPARVQAWVDGSELRAGRTPLDVRVDLPGGIELVRLEPAQVRVGASRRR